MLFVVFWVLWSLVGAMILSRSNRAGIGCMLGFFLGPIGALIAWFMKDTDRVECQHCRSLIDPRATICPFCRSAVTPRSDTVTQAENPQPFLSGLSAPRPNDVAMPKPTGGMSGLSAIVLTVAAIVIIFLVLGLVGRAQRGY